MHRERRDVPRRSSGVGEHLTALLMVAVLALAALTYVRRKDVGRWLEQLTGDDTAHNARLARLVAAMDWLDAQHVPYCLGGGHDETPARPTRPPNLYCWEGSPPRKVW